MADEAEAHQGRHEAGGRLSYVFVEIDMRNDFADDPRAVLPVPGTYAIVGKMRVLEENADAVIEVYDDHDPSDPFSKEEFKTFAPHCLRGTWGHQRIPGLHVPKGRGRHLKLSKNSYDAWKGGSCAGASEKELAAFHSQLSTADLIVAGGVVTGICVKAFVEGAVSRGLAKKTVVVSDCVANLEGVPGVPSSIGLFKQWGRAGVAVLAFDEFVKAHIGQGKCPG